MASVKKRTLKRGGVAYDVRYRDPRGRPRERSFRRVEDARSFAKTVEADVVRGEFLDPSKAKRHFDELAEIWLGTLGGRKLKTVVGYRSSLRSHVLPAFGGMAVGRIEPSDVRTFLSSLQDAGAGTGTVREARKILRLVLNTAVEVGAIKANPCDGVRLPRSEPQEMLFLTMDELLTLSDAMRRPEYGLLVRFAGLTGLRAGEIAALRVGRVDLLRRRVDVVENVSEVNGHGLVYGPTKTYERRSVPVPPHLPTSSGFCCGIAPVTVTRSSSPRRRARRCDTTTSRSATSSRPCGAPGCRTVSGSTICVIRAPRCSSTRIRRRTPSR